MTAVTRRVYDMCVRVLNWIGAHPDVEPGFVVLVAQLEALVARMTQVISEQRTGLVDSRAASERTFELRRAMRSLAIAHLAEIGGLAARELHELAGIFRFKPTARTYVAFQSAAQSMFDHAQEHKEVLVKYGLSESVLAQLGTQLKEFESAATLGREGRTVHTAATRELDALTVEVKQIVRAMDARNRQRFQNDRAALEQWISARTILGTPRGSSNESDTVPSGEGGTSNAGDVRPAA